MTEQERYKALVDLVYKRSEEGELICVTSDDLVALVPQEQEAAWLDVIARASALTQVMAQLKKQSSVLEAIAGQLEPLRELREPPGS